MFSSKRNSENTEKIIWYINYFKNKKQKAKETLVYRAFKTNKYKRRNLGTLKCLIQKEIGKLQKKLNKRMRILTLLNV